MVKITHWIFGTGIDYFLYLVLLFTVLYIVKALIEGTVKTKFNEMQYLYRLRKVRANTKIKERHYEHPFLKHIYMLLKTTAKEKKENDVISFFVISGSLSLFTIISTFISFRDVLFSLILGLLVGSIPYMFLQVRLRSLRYQISTDFLGIVQVLAQNYNASQYDMYYCLIQTQKDIDNKALKRVFTHLISDLQVSRNESEIRLAVDLFIFTIGNSWAKRLGNIIMKAYLYDEKVTNTLLTLIKQMEETEEMLEEEASNTVDSVFNGFLTIPLFLASLVLSYYATQAKDWFNLQFGHYWPRLLFVVCTVLVVISLIISIILRKPKKDI